MLKHLPRIVPIAALSLMSLTTVHAQEFVVNNLITNDQAANKAQFTDPEAVNIWGISHSGGSPFWVSDNGTGGTTLYTVNPITDHVTKNPVGGAIIHIPGSNATNGPTGQVNTSGDRPGSFNGDAFLFVTEEGVVAGWRGPLGANAETLGNGAAGSVYKGSAFATIGSGANAHSYLYAANFSLGSIDIYKGDGGAPNLTGNFTDPNLPAGYSPFNIQNLNGKLYVTYAEPNGPMFGNHDEIDGAGLGFVDVYDLQGNFLSRVGTQGTLNAPWGLAIAPASYGKFANDLLVGNFGDGAINAYTLGATSTFAGQLDGTNGQPISIDGLWGLSVGNNGSAGSLNRVYFSAGPQGESNGLFGSLTAVPEPGVNAMLVAGLLSTGLFATRRSRKRA
jgi:uncharacterized protein (TIGR03118 family)